MKKIVTVIALTASVALGGCANLQNAWDVLANAAVSPTQIIVAGNTFDALEATATQYLSYCKSVGYVPQPCKLVNRRPVVQAVRAGRAARNGLEPYVVAGTAGPQAIYNTLVQAISTLQASPMPTTGAK